MQRWSGGLCGRTCKQAKRADHGFLCTESGKKRGGNPPVIQAKWGKQRGERTPHGCEQALALIGCGTSMQIK